MHWREPLLIFAAIILGAWLVKRYPGIDLIGKISGGGVAQAA